MKNNQVTKFIAVKDSILKTLLVDQMVEAGIERFKSQNITGEALRRFWTMVFRAPVIIFVYSDMSGINPEDRDFLTGINFSIAGQSVSQMGFVAADLGLGLSVIGGERSMIAEDGIRKVLNTPAGYRLVNIIGIGYPLEQINPAVTRPASEYLIIK
jgi:nitroreductase